MNSMELLISGFRSPRCSTVFTLILPPTMMMSTGLVIPIGRSLPTSAHEARTFAKLIHLGREQVLLRIQVAPMEGWKNPVFLLSVWANVDDQSLRAVMSKYSSPFQPHCMVANTDWSVRLLSML